MTKIEPFVTEKKYKLVVHEDYQVQLNIEAY